MKKITVISVLGLLATVAALSFVDQTAVAQPPGGAGGPGGRGGPGLMQAMMFVEQAWAALAFEVKVSPEQLQALYPAYQQAWDERKAAQEELRALRQQGGQGREAMGQAFQKYQAVLEKIRADLEAAHKKVLTEEQLTQLQQWLEAQARMRGPGGGRPGGGGGAQ